MTWTWDFIAHRSLLVVSLSAWLIWGARRWRGQRGFLPEASREVAPWGLLDLVLAFLIWGAVLALGQIGLAKWLAVSPGTSLRDMTPAIVVPWLVGNGLWLWLATLAAMGAITWRGGVRRVAWWSSTAAPFERSSDQANGLRGAWANHLLRDVALGIGAFVLLAAPVLGLQEWLAQRFPTRHPLVELLLATPRLDLVWAVGFSAVLVAPLVEELQFRVLLQGWLMRVAESGEPRQNWLYGADFATTGANAARYWPVAASAALFALAHWSHGPDPLPLFLFALGLGELYRRTRRVVPVVVAHMSLNAWSIMLLAAEVLRARPA